MRNIYSAWPQNYAPGEANVWLISRGGTVHSPARSLATHQKATIMSNALSLFEGPQNLSVKERGISIIAGLGLAAAATKPRPNPLLNVVALLGGAYLAMRGATGRCPVKQAFQSIPAQKIAANGKRAANRSPAAGP
jgi:uncharacterized membrane protein